MKKILSILFVICILSVSVLYMVSCGEDASGDATTLYVYNWGEYISDGSEDSLDVNKEFEKYCKDVLGKNVKVNYSTFASNEDLYAKLSSGSVSYDVIIPSDYMIARLIDENLIQKINPVTDIENFENIDDDYKNLYYDPTNEYSVPYTFGTVGIIYNTTMVDEEDIGSWSLMWNEKYKGNILQFNNPRDAIATAQFYLGYDINSTDASTWENAVEKLKEQKPIVQGWVMDEVFNKMKSGSAAIAPYYAGDFFTMYADNEDLAFYFPSEGTNIYVDAMCVPTSSKNVDLAKEYINFMLTEEIAVANAEYICYASPNKLVVENEDYIAYMTEECHEDAMDILYSFDRSNMDFYHDLPDDIRLKMNELWEGLKIQSTISSAIYIVCGVIVVALIVAVVVIVSKKKKKLY